MLIACNTHIPTKQREVQSNFHDQVHRSFANVAISETSKEDPESQKRCLRTMLTTVTAQSRGTAYPDENSRGSTDKQKIALHHSLAGSLLLEMLMSPSKMDLVIHLHTSPKVDHGPILDYVRLGRKIFC